MYKIMTLYYTLEEVNNLYSDNQFVNSLLYSESAQEQEKIIKMKDQAHS